VSRARRRGIIGAYIYKAAERKRSHIPVPSGDPEHLIARPSSHRAIREPFRRAALAIARMPVALIGAGTVYRAVEGAWRRFFPPIDAHKASRVRRRAVKVGLFARGK
jgi:hypothetical protein